MSLVASFGFGYLGLTYLWLLSGIACTYLSARKGYGERPGLATGLLTSAVGIVFWLLWPAKEGSDWKLRGPIGRERKAPADDPKTPAVERS